jgi:hypothetical protein
MSIEALRARECFCVSKRPRLRFGMLGPLRVRCSVSGAVTTYVSFARFRVGTHGMSATFWTGVYLRAIVNSIPRWRGCVWSQANGRLSRRPCCSGGLTVGMSP